MQQTVQPEQSPLAREQSQFIGRMLIVPLFSLPMLAIWIVIAVVLTPLNTYDETMTALRWLLIGFGSTLIALVDVVALYRLLTWRQHSD